MFLCAERGRFLFEVRPDLFPAGYLTEDEIAVWGLYYAEQKKTRERNERSQKKG